MPYTGTAAMLDDGTASLRLRLASDGTPAHDILTYRVGDRAYDDILRHLGRSPSRRHEAVQSMGDYLGFHRIKNCRSNPRKGSSFDPDPGGRQCPQAGPEDN